MAGKLAITSWDTVLDSGTVVVNESTGFFWNAGFDYKVLFLPLISYYPGLNVKQKLKANSCVCQFRILLIVFLFAGCSGESSNEEPVDWIEVPLADATFTDSQREFHEGTYEILVLRESALEFKLGLKAGDSIVYTWTVEMEQPELLTAEFHGHTHRVGEEPGTVMFYKIHTEGKGAGTLVAPFEGIHGWYLNNQSDEDVMVNLHVAGFYEDLEDY